MYARFTSLGMILGMSLTLAACNTTGTSGGRRPHRRPWTSHSMIDWAGSLPSLPWSTISSRGSRRIIALTANSQMPIFRV